MCLFCVNMLDEADKHGKDVPDSARAVITAVRNMVVDQVPEGQLEYARQVAADLNDNIGIVAGMMDDINKIGLGEKLDFHNENYESKLAVTIALGTEKMCDSLSLFDIVGMQNVATAIHLGYSLGILEGKTGKRVKFAGEDSAEMRDMINDLDINLPEDKENK